MKNSLAVFLAVLQMCPAIALGATGAKNAPAPAPATSNDLPPPPPPPPPPPATPECYPQCRNGFFCHMGQCVSSCNPPCGPGEACATNGQCVASVPGEVSGRELRNDDNERAPPGYHYERHRRLGLMIGGLVPFGLGYFGSILYGIGSAVSSPITAYNGGGNALYVVPVLGPILREGFALSDGTRTTDYSLVYFDLLLTIVLTAAEGVGLLLTLLGLRTVQDLVSDRDAAKESGGSGFRWVIAPGAPGAPLGLSLVIAN